MDGAGGADIYERLVTFPERDLSENLRGTPLGDSIWGLGGNDVIVGLAGADWIDGGTGLDIAQWDKPFGSYFITREGSGWQVSDIEVSENSDFLIHVERIHFSDQRRAIDLDGNAGTAAKILGAQRPLTLHQLPKILVVFVPTQFGNLQFY